MAKALEAKDAINNPKIESTDEQASNIEDAITEGGLGKGNMGNFNPEKAQSTDSCFGRDSVGSSNELP